MVVDSPERNAALSARWYLTYPIYSDPGGERLLQPLGCWSPHERGGIAWPALLVVAPDGHEAYRYRSRDSADRREALAISAMANSRQHGLDGPNGDLVHLTKTCHEERPRASFANAEVETTDGACDWKVARGSQWHAGSAGG